MWQDDDTNQTEDSAWEAYKEGVSPLKSGNQRIANNEPSKALKKQKSIHKTTDKTPPQFTGGPEAPANKTRKEYRHLEANDSSGVDKKLAEKLRKGQLPIEATLDLHGMTQAHALPALESFITRMYHQQKRVLLIITGKGTRSETGKGVLQTQLPQWLNLASIRPFLLVYTHAQAKHGGSGAFYVLLKRVR